MRYYRLSIKRFAVCAIAFILSVSALAGCSSAKKSDSSENADTSAGGSDIDYNDYITLGEYIGVEAEQTKIEITDDDIDSYFEEEATNYEEVDRAVESGDYIVVDYTVYVEGEASEDLSDTGIGMEVGLYEIYDEFDDAVIGAKAGDSVDVNIDLSLYDESYDELLPCTIDITKVYEISIPELTDDYVTENTDYTTVDEYRQALYDELYEQACEEAVDELKYSAWEVVMDNASLDNYTDEMYEEQYELYMADMEYWALMFGYDDTDTFFEDWGYTDEDIVYEVEYYIEEEFVCRAIADAEGIEVTDDDISAMIEEYATEYGYDEVESFLEDYGYADVASFAEDYELEYYLLLDKVMTFVADNAVVVEVEAEDDE